MILEQHLALAAPIEDVWALLMDVPAVSRCVPGVEAVTALGGDTYAGVLRVKVGPIGARLEGTLVLAEHDRASWRARMDVRATDPRIGSAVNAKMTLRLRPTDDRGTELAVHTDAAVLGRLGQFGQAIIRRQADEIMAAFAQNLARALELAASDA